MIIICTTNLGSGKWSSGVYLPKPEIISQIWLETNVFQCEVILVCGIQHQLILSYHSDDNTWSLFDPNGQTPYMYKNVSVEQIIKMLDLWICFVVTRLKKGVSSAPVYKPLININLNDSPTDIGWCCLHTLVYAKFIVEFDMSPTKAQEEMIHWNKEARIYDARHKIQCILDQIDRYNITRSSILRQLMYLKNDI